jgi:hypothetical protein
VAHLIKRGHQRTVRQTLVSLEVRVVLYCCSIRRKLSEERGELVKRARIYGQLEHTEKRGIELKAVVCVYV